MKKTILFFLPLFIFNTINAQHKLVKLWQTDTLLKVPESVLPDQKNKVLYVSNIDGQPWEKDGKGSIGRVSMEGKILEVDWVSGLNCPKGMGLFKNKLYVADFTDVVVIDIEKGTIVKKIAVEGAQGLNDITVGKDGTVYVTDSKGFKLYKIENDVPDLLLENLQGPNGVLWHDNNLYVLDKGGLYKVGTDKLLTKLAEGMKPSTDGIEAVNSTDFIITCWAGAIYYVKGTGEKELLWDAELEGTNTADIGFDAATGILYVPTFYKNNIVAYKLQ